MVHKVGKSVDHMIEMKKSFHRNTENKKLIANAATFLRKNAKSMRLVNCIACDSKNYSEWAVVFGFAYSKCNQCGLIFMNPHPNKESLLDYYTLDNYAYNSYQSVNFNPATLKVKYECVYIPRFEFVNQFGNITTWLDIGTGNGEMVYSINKHTNGRVKSAGIDPSPDCINYAQINLNVKLIQSDIEDYIENEKLSFDVISLFGVLEHLSHPELIIKKLGEKMEKGSLLVMLVPVALSLSSIINKSNSDIIARHLTPPSHVTLWSEEAMKSMLSKHTFNIEGIWKYGQDCFEIFYYLCEKLDVKEKQRLLESMPALQDAIDRSGLSDEMIVVAKKY